MANSRGRGNGDWNQYDDSPYASNYQASQGSPYGRSGERATGSSSANRGASPYDQTGTDSAGYGQADAYGSPYDQQAQADAQAGYSYDQADYRSQSRASQGSPYGTQDPYASAGRSSSRSRSSASSRGSRGSAGSSSKNRVYQEGRGAAYTSTRPSASGDRSTNRAAGVRPVTRGEYVPGLGGYGNGVAGRGLSRRQLVAGGCAIGLVALLGVGGVTWWTHRAVACEVNGTQRDVPVSSTAADLIKKGYANPIAGNLVSISDDANPAEVLQQGGGNPYKLIVNGEEVDPASYRVKDSDKIEFQNGTDVVEESTKEETRTPCGGVQFRMPDGSLIDPNDATSQGIYLSTIGCVAQWGKEGVETVETGSVSGRVINHGVTQEAQNLIIAAAHINPVSDKPMLSLTFDDGPADPYTAQYLDILAQYGIKATFFNLGDNAKEYPELCKRCVDEGHQMASHTNAHMNLPQLPVDQMKSEVSTAYDSIEAASGIRPAVMRPPYGEYYCKQFLQTLGEMTYSAYWTVDSEDWRVAGQGQSGADAIVANCTKGVNATNYNGAVILMHDGGGDRSCDVMALPTIIETFLNLGYQFVTMDELIAADPTIPAWVSSGDPSIPADASMPDLTPYI